MNVVFLLECSSAHVCRVEQLGLELFRHALLGAAASVADDPAKRKARSAILRNLDRYLIVRTADAAALHYEERFCVLDRLLENFKRLVARPLANLIHGRV